MSVNKRNLKRLAQSLGVSVDGTADMEAAADTITLHRVDEAGAVARPAHIGDTWVEMEYDALRAEQISLWDAAGREASQPAEAEAFASRLAADAGERMTHGHEPILAQAEKRYIYTVEALSPYRRRPPKTKLLHYAAKTALLLGDMVGVTVMGINIGDYPILALLMSISAATAAVIAGLVGTEVRDLRMAQRRRRDPGTLTAAQLPFEHLFTGGDGGVKIVKILCGASATAAFLIAASIFAGRAELDGALVGLIYGGIAAAVATASFIESYMHADAISDAIDAACAHYEKELARHTRLAGSTVWRERHQKIAETESIVSEHASRGEAAAHHVAAIKWGILRKHPGVVGHGRGIHTGPHPGAGARR